MPQLGVEDGSSSAPEWVGRLSIGLGRESGEHGIAPGFGHRYVLLGGARPDADGAEDAAVEDDGKAAAEISDTALAREAEIGTKFERYATCRHRQGSRRGSLGDSGLAGGTAAPSTLAKARRLPPASTTAMHSGAAIFFDLATAAAMAIAAPA